MVSAIKSNPFYQPAKQWQIRVFAQISEIPAIEEVFGDLMLASSSFEINEARGEWAVDIITDGAPEKDDIHARLALASGLLGIATPRYELKQLEAKDWVSEVQKNFPPLHVGRFYVYGSHVKEQPPHAKIALKVNAGAAFGSGEHATTSGCLIALGELAKRRRFSNPLDMGCGSGILALAAAKLWHVSVTGTDIDPVSVEVSRGNALHNRVAPLSHFETANGYAAWAVRKGAPFDLIIANILARPLMRMAPQLAANLASGGIVILSGLLGTQERMVLAAHRAQGLTLIKRIPIQGWHTLVLKKR